MSEPRDTRRAALRRGLATGAVVAMAAPIMLRARTAGAAESGDIEIVEQAVELEQAAAIAYDAIAGRDLLDGEVKKAATLFAEQQREHVAALVAALEDLGGSRPGPHAPEEIEGLAELGSQEEALRFAIELEDELVATYRDAAATLESAAVLMTAAQIVGNAAQHLVVLRQQLGEDPVPSAFETGETST